MIDDITLLAFAVGGALAGCGFALLPGAHVYAAAAIVFSIVLRNPALSGAQLSLLSLGALVGWSVVNVVPAIFLYAPDDANANVVLPGTKWLMRGAGAQAATLTGAGSLCALFALVLLSPVLDEILRPLRAILQPHAAWMLLAVMVFLVLGEWPRANDRAPTPLARLASAWVYLGAGLLTFVLSGALGMVLMYRSPISSEAAFQNLMPAFVGLFTVPGAVQALWFGRRPPPQSTDTQTDVHPRLLLRGTLTGVAGGMFALLLPVVSGGIGGLLAGHATAQRDDRLFLVSQGASKVAYYVGSLLLLFVPGLTQARGGLGAMLGTLYVPYGWRMFWLAIAALAVCGALAFVVLRVMVGVAVRVLPRFDPRWLAGGSLALMAGLTFVFTGLPGIVVMLIAASIGAIPLVFRGRRLNCLGIVLLPVTLNIIGIGPAVARWLGIL